MLCTRRIRFQRTNLYATNKDFSAIFTEDMASLYLLSLLLTADREQAEQCFATALEHCLEGPRIFKDWTRSWSRRMIVQNAIRTVSPIPLQGQLSVETSPKQAKMRSVEGLSVAAVVRLEAFERFVFVMSVLERYPHHECAILLHCTRQEVDTAHSRALLQLTDAGLLRNDLSRNDLSKNSLSKSKETRPGLYVSNGHSEGA